MRAVIVLYFILIQFTILNGQNSWRDYKLLNLEEQLNKLDYINDELEESALYLAIAVSYEALDLTKAVEFLEKSKECSNSKENELLSIEIGIIEARLHFLTLKRPGIVKAIQIIDSLIIICRNKHYLQKEVYAVAQKINILEATQAYEKGIKLGEKTIKNDKIKKEIKGLGAIYNGIGNCYRGLSNFSKAIDALFKGINHAKIEKDTYTEGILSYNLAAVYYQMESEEEELSFKNTQNYGKRAIELAKKNNKTTQIAGAYNILAAIEFSKENYPEALRLFRESYNYYEVANNEVQVLVISTNIGEVQYKLKNYDEALKIANASLVLAEKYNISQVSIIVYSLLGSIHSDIGNYGKAEFYYSKGLAISHKIKNLDNQKDFLESLSSNSLKQGKCLAAINSLKQKIIISDSIYQVDKAKAVAEVEEKYKNKELAEKNKIQKERLIRNKCLLYCACCIGLLLLFLVWQLYRKNRKLKEQKREIERQNRRIQEEKENTDILLDAYETLKEKSITIGITKFPLDEILYARVRNKITTLFFEKKDENGNVKNSYYSYEITLQQLLEQLNIKSLLGFARINQNYIVNLQKVNITEKGKQFVIERLPIDKIKFSDVYDETISTLPRSEIGLLFQKKWVRFLKFKKAKNN